jgi:hypothetical protein
LKIITENFIHLILEYEQLNNKQDENAGKVGVTFQLGKKLQELYES